MEEPKTESDMLYELVYLWQQNSKHFNVKLPSEVREWFKSKFDKFDSSTIYYKGMHFLIDNLNDVKLDNLDFTSTTTDLEIATSFALGKNNDFYNSGYKCAVYKVTGDRVFNKVQECRDFDEDEFIVLNPRFKLIKVL